MNARNTLITAAATCLLAGSAGAQEYVRINPSFAPNGDAALPWNSLGVGLWATPNNGELRLNPGSYFEPGLLSPAKTVKLTAPGGPVKIAPYSPQKTTLRIASYNTHLFGNDAIPGLPRWNDAQRSPHIGRIAVNESADLFLMQEVWDPALFTSIRSVAQSTYPSGIYGGDKEGSSVLNSGLYTMSKHSLGSPAQVFYEDENGFFESMASKGYVRGTIVKNGFTVTVFNTHTQSGDSEDESQARQQQLIQLGTDVQVWRTLFPSHVVIVAGDINSHDTTAEYTVTMQLVFGINASMADGAMNMPVFVDPHSCTTCYSNDLRRHFDPDNFANKRLDYIMYANSADGSVRVVPRGYAVRDYEIPTGFSTLCDDDTCTRDLSDHYGIVLDLELQRP